MISNLAASHNAIASLVLSATPPCKFPLGDGRIKALGSLDNNSIRVLSPSIDPPDLLEVGSTANTATFKPLLINIRPKLSIKVDFPTPGVPVNPIRIDFLLLVLRLSIKDRASFL